MMAFCAVCSCVLSLFRTGAARHRHQAQCSHIAVPCSYTSAVLEATLAPTKQPPQLWRDTMAEMARVSCEAYRKVCCGLRFAKQSFFPECRQQC